MRGALISKHRISNTFRACLPLLLFYICKCISDIDIRHHLAAKSRGSLALLYPLYSHSRLGLQPHTKYGETIAYKQSCRKLARCSRFPASTQPKLRFRILATASPYESPTSFTYNSVAGGNNSIESSEFSEAGILSRSHACSPSSHQYFYCIYEYR